MTNMIAVVSASILLVVNTNWNSVGTVQLMNERRFQVLEGTRFTNTYVVFSLPTEARTNTWVFWNSVAGDILPEHKIIEQDEPPLQQPPPLPNSPGPRRQPTFRETGLLILKSK